MQLMLKTKSPTTMNTKKKEIKEENVINTIISNDAPSQFHSFTFFALADFNFNFIFFEFYTVLWSPNAIFDENIVVYQNFVE